jgi:hypothetical protein
MRYSIFDRTVGLILGCVLSACSTGPKLSSDPQVAACQRAAQAAQPGGLEQSKLAHLKAQADAFSQCMEQLGFSLDEEEFAARMLHFWEVKASDLNYGDPSDAMAAQRQILRLSPELWRPGSASKS